MPSFWGSHRIGRVVATEADKFYVPYGWKFNQSKRCIIWGHGAGGTYQIGPVERQLVEALGCVWVCATAGGGTSNLRRFGDDAACANYIAAFDKAKELFNVKPDKLVFWGGSMGGQSGTCLAFHSPTKVAAVAMTIPAINAEYVRANDVNGMKAHIETVYGANPVPAAKVIYNRGAAYAALGIPTAMWYSTDDVFTPNASYQQFIADCGPILEPHSLGAVGHSYSGMPTLHAEAVEFLRRYV